MTVRQTSLCHYYGRELINIKQMQGANNSGISDRSSIKESSGFWSRLRPFVNDSEEHYLPERRSPTPSPVGQRHEDKLLVEEICDEEAFLVKEEQKLPVVKLEERDSESD